MSGLLVAVPGLVLVACVGLFVLGLRNLSADPVDGLDVADLVLLRAASRDGSGDGPVVRTARRLVPLLRRLVGPVLLARLRRTIELAGRPAGVDEDTVLLRVATLVVLLTPLIAVGTALGAWWTLPAGVGAMVLLPLGTLARQRRLRQQRIDLDLPDFLDVLAVTVTAGVGFRSALAMVSERFGGPLAEEVVLTLDQVRNGASLRDAFRRLRERNDSPTLSTFVTAYLQSEELGAPLATTITRIAEDMRNVSAQNMRQRAARTAPQVTLVTSIVILPGAMALMLVGFFLGIEIDVGRILNGTP